MEVRLPLSATAPAERASAQPDTDIYAELLASAFERVGRPVRLLGVGVSFRNRSAPGEQLKLQWADRLVEATEQPDPVIPPAPAPE